MLSIATKLRVKNNQIETNNNAHAVFKSSDIVSAVKYGYGP